VHSSNFALVNLVLSLHVHTFRENFLSQKKAQRKLFNLRSRFIFRSFVDLCKKYIFVVWILVGSATTLVIGALKVYVL
jgi:hypothetical protein